MSKYTFEPYAFDREVYHKVDVADRWFFNKLALSERLGYFCGPSGTNAARAGDFIIRPILNLAGMGTGGVFKHTTDSWQDRPANDHVAANIYPGHFWCEAFDGPHQFVEYVNDVPMASTVGVDAVGDGGLQLKVFTEVDPATAPTLPEILRGVSRYALGEFIDGKLIEYSPRHIITCARAASITDYRGIDPTYDPVSTHHSLQFGFTDMRKVPYGKGGWTWEEIESTRRPFQFNP